MVELSKRVAMLLVAAAMVFICAGALAGFPPAVAHAASESDANLSAAKVSLQSADTATKISIKNCSISVKASIAYTGLPKKPVPVVVYKGKKLVKGVDFTLNYTNNTGIGVAKVTVLGQGKYTGSVTKKFKITYSNNALALAACRLSYSRARDGSKNASTANGYHGTPLFKKYDLNKKADRCTEVLQMAVKFMGIDATYPTNHKSLKKYLTKSKKWKRVGRCGSVKLKPGDLYYNGHTCIYVGKSIAKIAYADYLKTTDSAKAKQGKACADLGAPTADSAWVSSHGSYMGGSAAHICNARDALVSKNGWIFRYVGKGSTDKKGVTAVKR